MNRPVHQSKTNQQTSPYQSLSIAQIPAYLPTSLWFAITALLVLFFLCSTPAFSDTNHTEKTTSIEAPTIQEEAYTDTVRCAKCGKHHDVRTSRKINGNRLCPACQARNLKAQKKKKAIQSSSDNTVWKTVSSSSSDEKKWKTVRSSSMTTKSRNVRSSFSGLNEKKLQKLAGDVLQTMSQMNLGVRNSVDVHLVKSNQLTVKTSNGNLTTGKNNAVGKFRREGDHFEISIIQRVSSRKAVRILAHEFGHAFYEENYHKFKSRMYREGFSEWVSYKVLERIGDKRQMKTMKKRTDIYGQGLRLMLEAEKRGGVTEVIQTAMR